MIIERITDGPIKLQAQLYYVLEYTPRLLKDLKSTLDDNLKLLLDCGHHRRDGVKADGG